MVGIKDRKVPRGCQHCMYFRKHIFGNGLDYSYSCVLGATQFPMPWIRQMEERASDCPLVEIITCKDCKYYREDDDTGYCTNHTCGDITFWCHDDYYCADAVRKDVANE